MAGSGRGKERERLLLLTGPDARSVFILLLIAAGRRAGNFPFLLFSSLLLLLFKTQFERHAVRVISHDGEGGHPDALLARRKPLSRKACTRIDRFLCAIVVRVMPVALVRFHDSSPAEINRVAGCRGGIPRPR